MKTVAMLGDGAWGTAVATLLAHNGFTVKMWGYDPENLVRIKESHINERYVPGVVLDEKIIPTHSLQEVLTDVTWVFEAIPVQFLRSVLERVQPLYRRDQRWVVLSKGIEQDTMLLPGAIIDQVFSDTVSKVIFSGPSFAADLIKKQITAVTIASSDDKIGLELQEMLANEYFRPYFSHDEIGAQVGGAFKNVITIGVGMVLGVGGTDNAKAFIMTRGLHEMVQLAVAMGAHVSTLYGLSGVGDLVLSSMGALSRNLEVGKRLGRGQTVEQILKETGYIPEGINTVASVEKLMAYYRLDLPVFRGIHQVIFEEKPVNQMINDIMMRPLEMEI